MKKLMARARLGNKGFTLVELIIVIAIIAVLAAVLAPQYIKYVDKSKAAVDLNAMSELAHTVEIAIVEPTVYDELGTATFTVTYTDNAAALGYTVISAAAQTAITNAVTPVIGLPIDFKSKEYQGKTATITVTYNSTNKTFKVGAPAIA